MLILFGLIANVVCARIRQTSLLLLGDQESCSKIQKEYEAFREQEYPYCFKQPLHDAYRCITAAQLFVDFNCADSAHLSQALASVSQNTTKLVIINNNADSTPPTIDLNNLPNQKSVFIGDNFGLPFIQESESKALKSIKIEGNIATKVPRLTIINSQIEIINHPLNVAKLTIRNCQFSPDSQIVVSPKVIIDAESVKTFKKSTDESKQKVIVTKHSQSKRLFNFGKSTNLASLLNEDDSTTDDKEDSAFDDIIDDLGDKVFYYIGLGGYGLLTLYALIVFIWALVCIICVIVCICRCVKNKKDAVDASQDEM